jgi:osmotically-inducible protein OsmY
MFAKKIALAVFIATLGASVTGCASGPRQASAGEYVDDSAVTAKVKAAIFNEPTLKSTEVNVETFKGVVQLSGFVAQREDIRKAGQVARDVNGVKSVRNDLRSK